MKKLRLLLYCIFLLGVCGSCTKEEHDLYGTLYGIVTDHATGEPLGSAAVELLPSGKTQTTGADGRFEFDRLDPQQYTIQVRKAGYRTNRKTVTAITGERVPADISLTKNN